MLRAVPSEVFVGFVVNVIDAAAAAEVLASGRYANEVRQLQAFFRQLGISSVPAVIIERKHLVSGGQPPEVFEQALRQIAAQAGQQG